MTTITHVCEGAEIVEQSLESGCHLPGNTAEPSRPEGVHKLTYLCTLSRSTK